MDSLGYRTISGGSPDLTYPLPELSSHHSSISSTGSLTHPGSHALEQRLPPDAKYNPFSLAHPRLDLASYPAVALGTPSQLERWEDYSITQRNGSGELLHLLTEDYERPPYVPREVLPPLQPIQDSLGQLNLGIPGISRRPIYGAPLTLDLTQTQPYFVPYLSPALYSAPLTSTSIASGSTLSDDTIHQRLEMDDSYFPRSSGLARPSTGPAVPASPRIKRTNSLPEVASEPLVQPVKKSRSTRTDVKLFECPECAISFHRQHDLKRHTGIHLKVKAYPCEYCIKVSLDFLSSLHGGNISLTSRVTRPFRDWTLGSAM